MPEPSTNPAAALELLFEDLKTLRTALQDEDHEAATRLVAGHDRRLKQYCEEHGANAPAPLLQELLLLQQSLMADMIGLRDSAAAHLRTGHQSVRAAKAYHQAESLE